MSTPTNLAEQLFEIACRIVESDADESVLQILREVVGEYWVIMLLTTYRLHESEIQDSYEILNSVYAGAECLLTHCWRLAPREDRDPLLEARAHLEAVRSPH